MVLILLIAEALAGPVPMFGIQTPSTSVRPGAGIVVFALPFAYPMPVPGPVPEPPAGWELPPGRTVGAVHQGPTLWQTRRTSVEEPGRFVPVEDLGGAFEPMQEATNVLDAR